MITNISPGGGSSTPVVIGSTTLAGTASTTYSSLIVTLNTSLLASFSLVRVRGKLILPTAAGSQYLSALVNGAATNVRHQTCYSLGQGATSGSVSPAVAYMETGTLGSRLTGEMFLGVDGLNRGGRFNCIAFHSAQLYHWITSFSFEDTSTAITSWGLSGSMGGGSSIIIEGVA